MSITTIIEYFPQMLDGAWLSLQITGLSLFLGFLLAIPISLMRLSHLAALRLPAQLYMFYFRGTPLLVQLFLIYYGSGQFRHELAQLGLWTFFRDAWFCAVFALTLNACAYTAEIFRGAILSVPKGDIQAGKAFGMSGLLLFRRIIFPKALRIALPSYGNEVIFLLQASSLVSIITLMDLTGVASRLVAKTFAVYEIYILTAVIYIAITYMFVVIFKLFERMLNQHLRTDS
ncbi:MAG: ABC transporter permease [Gammaproteobacteria bacterium]|nr:ABC transporter permease [Gammaproteobacteria bacterium]